MSTIIESHHAAQDLPSSAFEVVVVEPFRQWLYLPDDTPLLLLLACVVANVMQGDPIWLMLIGPPGSCKTELMGSLLGLPYNLHSASSQRSRRC